MLMRESRQCNLNSVDIYCQVVLIHRHPLLHGLTQHQQAAGSGERHAPFTVLLADFPSDCCCDQRHTTPNPWVTSAKRRNIAWWNVIYTGCVL